VLERIGGTNDPYRAHNVEAALFAQGSIEMRRMV
jgi:hypothetical protein